MKTGDLVKLKQPTTRDFDKVFMVVDTLQLGPGARVTYGEEGSNWLKLDGPEGWVTSGWTRSADYEVISESGR